MDYPSQVYKTLLIGDQSVGKSSLLLNYTQGEFRKEYTVTIGLEFGSKVIQIDKDTSVTLQIWDTAGQEAFKSIIRSFYRNAAAVFIIYSINKRESFDNVDEWCREVRTNSHQDVIIVLLANKCDLSQARQVQEEEGQQKKKEIGADLYFETSGKEGDNINEAFRETAKLISKRVVENNQFKNSITDEEQKQPNQKQSISNNDLTQDTKKQKKEGCC